MDVQYFPLTMTSEEGYHSAELFVALPDGSAVLYNLQGKAGPPETLVIEPLTTPAKASTNHSTGPELALDPTTLGRRVRIGRRLGRTRPSSRHLTFDVGAETRNYVLRFYSIK